MSTVVVRPRALDDLAEIWASFQDLRCTCPDLKHAGKNCGQQSCYILRHCGDSVQGSWCNGNIALCPSRRCGFESRRVHSPYLWRIRCCWGDNTEIISPSNLT